MGTTTTGHALYKPAIGENTWGALVNANVDTIDRNLPQLYNVKNYGAVGNGSTDDTAAFDSAITAANAAGGGIVFVPASVYIVDGVRAQSNVTIMATSGTTLKLKSSSTNNAAIRRPASGNLVNFIIDGNGMTVDGNAAGQVATRDAIALDVTSGSISRLSVRNVKVLNAYRHGIFIAEDTPTDGYKEVVGCEVDGHGVSTVGYGIYFDFAPGGIITRNVVRNAGNSSDAIEMGNAGKYICTHNTLEDSQLQFPFADDAVIAHNLMLGTRSNIQNDANTADRVRIIGNTIMNCTPDTLSFGAISVKGDDAIIIGNSCQVTTHRGIRTYGVRPIIMGNRVETTSATAISEGIHCEVGEFAKVIGNNIIGKWQHGIYVEHDWNLVTNNYIEADSTTGTCISLGASGDIGMTLDNTLIQGNQLAVGNTKFNGNGQTASTNHVKDNIGYQPQGTATISVGASPFTYINQDLVPEAVYIRSGTVSDVSKNSRTIFVATNCTVWLAPGETVTVTYSSAPTMEKDRK